MNENCQLIFNTVSLTASNTQYLADVVYGHLSIHYLSTIFSCRSLWNFYLCSQFFYYAWKICPWGINGPPLNNATAWKHFPSIITTAGNVWFELALCSVEYWNFHVFNTNNKQQESLGGITMASFHAIILRFSSSVPWPLLCTLGGSRVVTLQSTKCSAARRIEL